MNGQSHPAHCSEDIQGKGQATGFLGMPEDKSQQVEMTSFPLLCCRHSDDLKTHLAVCRCVVVVCVRVKRKHFLSKCLCVYFGTCVHFPVNLHDGRYLSLTAWYIPVSFMWHALFTTHTTQFSCSCDVFSFHSRIHKTGPLFLILLASLGKCHDILLYLGSYFQMTFLFLFLWHAVSNGNTTRWGNSRVGKPFEDKYQIRHVTTQHEVIQLSHISHKLSDYRLLSVGVTVQHDMIL